MNLSKKLPNKKFSVIYADPPWSFKAWSSKGTGRGASQHYSTLKTKDICKIPVADIAEKNCVLLLWAVMPQLPEALRVIDEWGFKFKTVGFTWMKQNPKAPSLFYDANDIFKGMGYWTRSNSELCLLATRGNPKRINTDVAQAIFSPLREHSRKPAETYERIERLVSGPYIELFARNRRAGWDSWGAETRKFGR